MKNLTILLATLFSFFLSGCGDQSNHVIEPGTDYELTEAEELVQGEDEGMREQYEEDDDR